MATATKPATRPAATKTNTKAAAPARDPAKKPLTKPEWIARLMADCAFSRPQATAVYDWFGTIAAKELGRKGPGTFTVPGLVKLTCAIKPATKARPGRNPATGESMTIAARPAHPVVRASVAKALADAIESGK